MKDLKAIALSAPVRVWQPGDEVQVRGDMVERGQETAALRPRAKRADPLLGASRAGRGAVAAAPTTVASFDGIPATGVLPPDTVGAVGPNNYIQMVNSAFAIYDKTGTLLAGPSPINSLWLGFGGPCESQNNGDPIVRYDHLADRWLLSQFAIDDHMQCIAISRGADPVTSGWFLYAFRTVTADGTEVTPDYPKIGVWPDGYYMSTQRGFPDDGLDVWVFERDKMINGQAARQVTFAVSKPSLILLPSDLNGSAPAMGTPNFFVRQVDGDRFGGQDRLEIFAFSVNWANPNASTFQLASTLPTAAFDSVLCQATLMGACVPQPGGAPRLETLTVWTMWRAQYRNFQTYETLLLNHTVDATGADLAGVRWYELRRQPSGPWSIHQQGTHAPDNTLHRWMGSIAMDEKGNIALGYSVSSATVFPGIRAATRLASDPLGSLAQGEITLQNGSGSQTFSPAPRWGNYSSMDVDPSQHCTFWYTAEYYDATSQAGWKTRIISFRMPSSSCEDSPPPPPQVRECKQGATSDGSASCYLTGTYDLRNNAITLLHIINPTGHPLLVYALFFDDDEHPLACLYTKMSPNDLWEIPVNKLGLKPHRMFGVVKAISFRDPPFPMIGIVGNQRISFGRQRGVSETPLHPIQGRILDEDIEKVLKPIIEKCKHMQQ